jgi:hypothetical protein
MIFNDEKQQDQQGQGGSKKQCCNNKREFAHSGPRASVIGSLNVWSFQASTDGQLFRAA